MRETKKPDVYVLLLIAANILYFRSNGFITIKLRYCSLHDYTFLIYAGKFHPVRRPWHYIPPTTCEFNSWSRLCVVENRRQPGAERGRRERVDGNFLRATHPSLPLRSPCFPAWERSRTFRGGSLLRPWENGVDWAIIARF